MFDASTMHYYEFDGISIKNLVPNVAFESCFENKFVYRFFDYQNSYQSKHAEVVRKQIYRLINENLNEGEICELYSQTDCGIRYKVIKLGPCKKHITITLDGLLETEKILYDERLKVTIVKRRQVS